MRFKFLLFGILIAGYLNAQVTINMKREGGVSSIPCKVNGLLLQFIFDTGASEVSMSLTEASFMLKNGYLSKADIIGKANYLDANGNLSEGITLNLKEVDIGGLKLRNVSATVVKNLKAPLLLGQSALRKLGKIEFDLEENTITIIPVKSAELANNRVEDLPDNGDSMAAFVDSMALIVDTIGYASEVESVSKDVDYFIKGLGFYEDDEYDAAIEYFDMAIYYNSSNRDYYIYRGLSKDMIDNWKEAIDDYSSALKIDPKHSNAYAYRAESRCRVGDTLAALSDIKAALQFDPKNGYAYRERGIINYSRKVYASAISDFSISLKYAPEDCYTYRMRGLAKFYSNKYNSAKLDFDSAIILCNGDAYSWMMRGAAKIELKDFDGALIDLDKSIDLDPGIGGSYVYKAEIAEENGELEEAIALLEKAIELDSGNLWAHLQLGLLKHELKNRIWISISSTNDGDEWFIKNEEESREYGKVRLWLKKTQKKYTHKNNGKSVTYSNVQTLYLATIDCKQKKLLFEYVSCNDSNGNVIFREEFDYPEWQIVPPGSIGEAIIKEACDRYN